ncbi:MAG: hypothetical protein IEMM0002_0726 [bacterium]|nr:MAG: hypothetical protein IEMM0002_0726 [bacterium]
MKGNTRKLRGITLIGFKCSGKTRIGKFLGKKLGMDFLDIDRLIEDVYAQNGRKRCTVRTIYKKFGSGYFQDVEAKALEKAIKAKGAVLSLGGGTPLNSGFRKTDFKDTVFVYLDVKPAVLYERIKRKGLPPFLDRGRPKKSFNHLFEKRTPMYKKFADVTVDNSNRAPAEVCREIIKRLEERVGR